MRVNVVIYYKKKNRQRYVVNVIPALKKKLFVGG